MKIEKDIMIAKKIITEEIEKRGLKLFKIVLFGSMARGDYNADSDWDFLVIVDKDLSFNKKWRIITEIQRKLASFDIPNDIIINSKFQAENRKNDVGRITYYALKEGMEI